MTGSSGKLGREILKLRPDAKAPSHAELDITDFDKLRRYIERQSIDTVIHCAAMTSVRECEERRREALEVNVDGTRNLVYVISERPSGYFVYISTACVFPGDERDRFYTENDVPYPKNFYGLTKFLAENVVKDTADLRRTLLTLIIRTNFVSRGKWMYRTAFTDRFGTYLYSDQVAVAILKFVDQRRTGTIHICGDKRVSMYELARLNDLDVKPMTLQNYDGPPLTINMCLSSTIAPRITLEA